MKQQNMSFKEQLHISIHHVPYLNRHAMSLLNSASSEPTAVALLPRQPHNLPTTATTEACYEALLLASFGQPLRVCFDGSVPACTTAHLPRLNVWPNVITSTPTTYFLACLLACVEHVPFPTIEHIPRPGPIAQLGPRQHAVHRRFRGT
jgi:hypothetical protein